MDNQEARKQAQRNSETMQRFKTHVVNDMVSDEHTDAGLEWKIKRHREVRRPLLKIVFHPKKDHTDDLKLFEQKLMMHFNPQFIDEEHNDHQAAKSHWFITTEK